MTVVATPMVESPTSLDALIERIDTRAARIGVIGLGYVGLPLVLLFAESGFEVTGFDVDPKKAQALNAGESYIRHIGTGRVRMAFVEQARASATIDFQQLAACDAVIICVPTPLGDHREPDLSYVRATADAIAQTLQHGQLMILESTTYPGPTREGRLPRFKPGGLC